MSFKITAYGVRSNEVESFNKLNKYDFELNLLSENLAADNVQTAAGSDAVLLRGNNLADKRNLDRLNEMGIKYVFTRTVGYNHIDVSAAKANGQLVAYVPGYSPYSVAELAFTLGLTLQRNTALAAYRSSQKDFRVQPDEFATEIHDLTVGIIGTGRIGRDEAQLWQGANAKVIGYDLYPSKEAEKYLTYVDEKELLAKADIVSLHVPYFPNSNHHYFNDEYLNNMKDGAILVNTARAEITDVAAILNAVDKGKLKGFATDVIENESKIFGKEFQNEKLPDELIQKAVELFPKVLITPHIGSYTEEALKDMISISYDNFNDVLTTGKSKNLL